MLILLFVAFLVLSVMAGLGKIKSQYHVVAGWVVAMVALGIYAYNTIPQDGATSAALFIFAMLFIAIIGLAIMTVFYGIGRAWSKRKNA